MPKVPKVRSKLDQLREYANSLSPQVGFFSTLDELIQQAPFERNSADQWRAYLQPGRMLRRDEAQFPLKKEELQYALEEALKGSAGDSTISKERLLGELRDRRPSFNLRMGMFDPGGAKGSDIRMQMIGQDDLSPRFAIDPLKYRDHRLAHTYTMTGDRSSVPARYEESVTGMEGLDDRSHFNRDTLSWGRTTTHQLPTNERVRLIEEIQSDLHQRAAARHGDWEDYTTPEEDGQIEDLIMEEDDLAADLRESERQSQMYSPSNSPEVAARYREDQFRIRGRIKQIREELDAIQAAAMDRRPRRGYRTPEDTQRLHDYATIRNNPVMTIAQFNELKGRVPDAPFKDPSEYALLEMRKQLLNAVNNDEDYLALVRAADQQARYSLDDTDEESGMRLFYDKIYPDVLRKLGKRYGAEMAEVEVPIRQGEDIRIELLQDFNFENARDLMEGLADNLSGVRTDEDANTVFRIAEQAIDQWDQWGRGAGEGHPLVAEARAALQQFREAERLNREYRFALDDDDQPLDTAENQATWDAYSNGQERLTNALKALETEWDRATFRENPDLAPTKKFPALRLTPEVRERIKRIGVPLWSIAGGTVMFDDEEPQQFDKGGLAKKPTSTGLKYLRSAAESLAGNIPLVSRFLSPEQREQLTEDISRPLAGLASQWYAPDPETGEPTLFLNAWREAPGTSPWTPEHLVDFERSPTGRVPMPGIVAETEAMPADFTDIYNLAAGTDHLAPLWSVDAQGDSALLREGIMEQMNLDEPSGFKEHLLESGGIMAGQLPVGAGPKLAQLSSKYLRAAMTPISAAAEWLSPVVDPKIRNYAQGALFGAGMGTGVEWLGKKYMEGMDPRAVIAEGIRTGEITDEEGEALLRQLFPDDIDPVSPEQLNFAKGGNVKPPRLQLRERLAELAKEAELKSAGVEGTGRELVPVDRPLSDTVNATVNIPDLPPEQRLQDLKVTRRDVLEGMAALASPLPNPLELIAESPAPAAARTVAAPKPMRLHPLGTNIEMGLGVDQLLQRQFKYTVEDFVRRGALIAAETDPQVKRKLTRSLRDDMEVFMGDQDRGGIDEDQFYEIAAGRMPDMAFDEFDPVELQEMGFELDPYDTSFTDAEIQEHIAGRLEDLAYSPEEAAELAKQMSLVGDPEFLETDSSNPYHATGYWNVEIDGPEELVDLMRYWDPFSVRPNMVPEEQLAVPNTTVKQRDRVLELLRQARAAWEELDADETDIDKAMQIETRVHGPIRDELKQRGFDFDQWADDMGSEHIRSNVDKAFNRIVRERTLEDRMEYQPQDLAEMYELNPEEAQALYDRLHDLSEKEAEGYIIGRDGQLYERDTDYIPEDDDAE